jgi:hypothetical protein
MAGSRRLDQGRAERADPALHGPRPESAPALSPSEDDVAEAFANADRFVDDTPERRHLWRRRGDRWLKVTFVEGARVVTIITVAMFETGPPESEEADGDERSSSGPRPRL